MGDLKLYERVAPLEKNFPIKISRFSGRSYLHWHEHIELLYYFSDDNRVFCGDRVYDVGEGELLVVNSGELHATYTGEFCCIRVNPSFFADVHFENVLFQPHIAKDETIRKYVFDLLSEKEARAEGYDLRIKGMMYMLLSYMMQNYRVAELSKNDAISRKNKTSNVGEMLTYIAHHCNEKITTAALAEQFHLNENYLCHLFKSQTELSPVEYINKFRVERASVLLKNSSQSITDIALEVGFEDPSYFARVFKKYMGVTPREYKKSKTV